MGRKKGEEVSDCPGHGGIFAERRVGRKKGGVVSDCPGHGGSFAAIGRGEWAGGSRRQDKDYKAKGRGLLLVPSQFCSSTSNYFLCPCTSNCFLYPCISLQGRSIDFKAGESALTASSVRIVEQVPCALSCWPASPSYSYCDPPRILLA